MSEEKKIIESIELEPTVEELELREAPGTNLNHNETLVRDLAE